MFVVAIALTLTNGIAMLASPKLWFRLPAWVKTQGTFTEAKHSTGAGALQVRILGAIFVIVVPWMP